MSRAGPASGTTDSTNEVHKRFGLAKSISADSWRTKRNVAVAKGNTADRAARQPSTSLMPVGCCFAIPRLDGVPREQQLWQGEDSAARLARSFLEAGVADAEDWFKKVKGKRGFGSTSLQRICIALLSVGSLVTHIVPLQATQGSRSGKMDLLLPAVSMP